MGRGLLALLAHALRGGGHADVAARRFSAVALWCFVAMGISGVINALVRMFPGDLFDTRYGLLILVKLAALVALGCWAGGSAGPGWLPWRPTPRRGNR